MGDSIEDGTSPDLISQNLKLIKVTKYDSYLYLSAHEGHTGIQSKIKLDFVNNTISKITKDDRNLLTNQLIQTPHDHVETSYFSLLLGIVNLSGKSFLLFAENVTKCANICNSPIYKIESLHFLIVHHERDIPQETMLEIKNKIDIIKNLFSKGFYFSFKIDLTKNYLNNTHRNNFMWNLNLMKIFDNYGFTDWNISIIRGYIGELVINENFYYSLISRRVFPNSLGFN